MRIFLRILVFVTLATMAAFTAFAQQGGGGATPEAFCYLVADNDGNADDTDVLTRFHKITHEETAIGLAGTHHIEAISFSPTAPVLYAADGGRLGMLDLDAGTYTDIGAFGSGDGATGHRAFTDVDGLAFDPSTGILYGSVRKTGADLLIQINPTTGAAVKDAFGDGIDYLVIDSFSGLDDVDDLAVDPQSGHLYAILNEDGEQSHLIAIDPITGVTTDIADLDVENVEGLSFDHDGTLLGALGNGEERLVEIDMRTGATTTIGTLGVNGNRDYEALTCLTHNQTATALADEPAPLPADFALSQNYPNPFNPATTIRFTLDAPMAVRLTVYDMLGRTVAVLADGLTSAGTHEVRFDATSLPGGLYLYALDTPTDRIVRSMTLVK